VYETIQPTETANVKIVEDRCSFTQTQAIVTVRSNSPVPAVALEELRSNSAAAVAAGWAQQKLGRCGHNGIPWPIALDTEMNRIPGDQLLSPTTVVAGYENEITFNAFQG
jgi:hypothetical protein